MWRWRRRRNRLRPRRVGGWSWSEQSCVESVWLQRRDKSVSSGSPLSCQPSCCLVTGAFSASWGLQPKDQLRRNGDDTKEMTTMNAAFVLQLHFLPVWLKTDHQLQRKVLLLKTLTGESLNTNLAYLLILGMKPKLSKESKYSKWDPYKTNFHFMKLSFLGFIP